VLTSLQVCNNIGVNLIAGVGVVALHGGVDIVMMQELASDASIFAQHIITLGQGPQRAMGDVFEVANRGGDD
jgi:hypothetical protein